MIKKWRDCMCLVCNTNFNDCGCYYDIGDAYMEEIEKIIEKK